MKTISSTRGPILARRALGVAWSRYAATRTAGRRLAWSREAAGISQQELAAYVGVSTRTIQRVEAGERAFRPAEAAAAARALGCSIATLTAPAIALPPASMNGNGNGKAVAA